MSPFCLCVTTMMKVPCGWRFIPPTPNVPLCALHSLSLPLAAIIILIPLAGAEWLDIQPPWVCVEGKRARELSDDINRAWSCLATLRQLP